MASLQKLFHTCPGFEHFKVWLPYCIIIKIPTFSYTRSLHTTVIHHKMRNSASQIVYGRLSVLKSHQQFGRRRQSSWRTLCISFILFISTVSPRPPSQDTLHASILPNEEKWRRYLCHCGPANQLQCSWYNTVFWRGSGYFFCLSCAFRCWLGLDPGRRRVALLYRPVREVMYFCSGWSQYTDTLIKATSPISCGDFGGCAQRLEVRFSPHLPIGSWW